MNSLIQRRIEQQQREMRKRQCEALFQRKRVVRVEKPEEIDDQPQKLIDQEQYKTIISHIQKEYQQIKTIVERFQQFKLLVKICIDYLQPENHKQLKQMVDLLKIYKLLKSWIEQAASEQCIPKEQQKKVLEEFLSDVRLKFSQDLKNTISLNNNGISQMTGQIQELTIKNFCINTKFENLQKEMQTQRKKCEDYDGLQKQLNLLEQTNQQLEEKLKRHHEEFQIYKTKKDQENSLLEKEISSLKKVISEIKDQKCKYLILNIIFKKKYNILNCKYVMLSLLKIHTKKYPRFRMKMEVLQKNQIFQSDIFSLIFIIKKYELFYIF